MSIKLEIHNAGDQPRQAGDISLADALEFITRLLDPVEQSETDIRFYEIVDGTLTFIVDRFIQFDNLTVNETNQSEYSWWFYSFSMGDLLEFSRLRTLLWAYATTYGKRRPLVYGSGAPGARTDMLWVLHDLNRREAGGILKLPA